jgi:uncharacterized cupin superfamily protein
MNDVAETLGFAASTSAASADWEDYIIDGAPVGEVHNLRGTADDDFNTGFYRIRGGTTSFDYDIEHNKTVYVIEGQMKVAVVDGETLVLAPGDAASFSPGLKTHWEVVALPYMEMFVQS